MSEWVPVTGRGQAIQKGMSAERWAKRVAKARHWADALEMVDARVEAGGISRRSAVAEAAPGLEWSAYLHLRRARDGGEGPVWERLLDGRVPPIPPRVSDDLRLAACMLRRADRSINTETARKHLGDQFGERGALSDAALRRIWAAADLRYVGPATRGCAVGEEVVEYNGGGGLALLSAADEELEASLSLALAAQKAGAACAAQQEAPVLRAEIESHRDKEGHFTSQYNHAWRADHAPGDTDERWAEDADKRVHIDLSKRTTLEMRPETIAKKLLSMGVMPMLTERRGFSGLDGPSGAWLGVLGGTAYMPSTLSKALSELGMLDVDEALWSAHGQQWSRVSMKWTKSAAPWVRAAIYIDGTADPYWTQRYAKSGPVSRVGRVMPSLTRIAVTSGAGVPLLVETFAGAASLKKHLIPVLQRLDSVLGPDAEVGRLTVVDSEVGSAGLMWALHETAERVFITVIKGAVLKGATLLEPGEWVPYRERDEVRELWVHLRGKDAPKDGITVRGVEMRRPESRHPSSTLFVTNADPQEFSTSDIATTYLARWPCQEQLFRDTRNGGGLNRSHGYGGANVSHVMLETKKALASRSVVVGEGRHSRAEVTREELDEGTRGLPIRKETMRLANQAVRTAEHALETRHAKHADLEGHPTEIFERDTGRDSTMTCLKLSALMLIEYVLKEYFGGLPIECRTFIEHFVNLPVTVRTTRQRRLFQIHANPRQPKRMAQLAAALTEVNRRRVHRDGRLLVFELLGFDEVGST